MKAAIISGSNRKNSESLRVAHFLKKRMETVTNLEPSLIDLNATPIGVSPDENAFGHQDENFRVIAKNVEESDALVIISPEWSGMASPMLKALLVFMGPVAAYKPALLVGVSAGVGGAFPISELKATGNKNNFIVFLPEYLIFRKVGGLLKTEAPESEEDKYIRERSDYALQLLQEFSKNLQNIRKSNLIDLKKYPFGM